MREESELLEYFAVLTPDGRWTGRVVGKWGVRKDSGFRYQSLGKTDSIEKARQLAEALFGPPEVEDAR